MAHGGCAEVMGASVGTSKEGRGVGLGIMGARRENGWEVEGGSGVRRSRARGARGMQASADRRGGVDL